MVPVLRHGRGIVNYEGGTGIGSSVGKVAQIVTSKLKNDASIIGAAYLS